MTATSILPSIKVSKSGSSRSPIPNTSGALASDEAGSGSERPTTSGNDGKDLKESSASAGELTVVTLVSTTNGGISTLSNDSATKFSKSASVIASDPEKLQSPMVKRRGMPQREGTATAIIDPLTMQILRRTGTEGTVRQKARKDSNDRKDTSDDAPSESVPRVPEGHSPDIVRHMDAQPQAKEKKFVSISFQSRVQGMRDLLNM